jgi:hypothetical protein
MGNEVSMPALLAAIHQSNAQMLHNMSSFKQTVATLQTEIANIRTEKKSDMETITAAAIDAAKTAVAMQTPKKDKDKPVPAEIQKANRAKLEAALMGRRATRSVSPRRHTDSGQAGAKVLRADREGGGTMGAGAGEVASREAAEEAAARAAAEDSDHAALQSPASVAQALVFPPVSATPASPLFR